MPSDVEVSRATCYFFWLNRATPQGYSDWKAIHVACAEGEPQPVLALLTAAGAAPSAVVNSKAGASCLTPLYVVVHTLSWY